MAFAASIHYFPTAQPFCMMFEDAETLLSEGAAFPADGRAPPSTFKGGGVPIIQPCAQLP